MSGMDLAKAVGRVVSADLCCGCGACTLLDGVGSMVLGENGMLHPVLDASASCSDEGARFGLLCPGEGLRSPSEPGQTWHPVFGGYRGVWRAWARDEDIRFRGSSGGVLTALSVWLLESGRVTAVAGAGASTQHPTRSTARVARSREEVLALAGSRYAPVSVLAGLESTRGALAVVAKPCEAAALRAVRTSERADLQNVSHILSFFCAGTPRQTTTDQLVERLGVEVDEVASLRYRGMGCPGQFEVQARGGNSATMSYSESWGSHLGRSLPTRCKLCIDGTGEAADISVGDFWSSEPSGYPDLREQDGQSVVIARTDSGMALIAEAIAEGVIVAAEASLADVSMVQPLQVDRRLTIAGRLTGRLLSGHRVPRYRGYRMMSGAFRRPVASLRAAMGMLTRSLRANRSCGTSSGGSTHAPHSGR